MKKIIIILLSIGSALSNYAIAGTQTGNFVASSVISSTCNISASPINFGTLTKNSGSVWNAATGGLNIQCNKSTSYAISISSGQNVNNYVRYMKGAVSGQTIQYTICQSSGYNPTSGCTSQYWFNGTTNTYAVTGTADGSIKNYTMYGYAEPGYYTPDTYSDTEVATITY